MLRLAIEEECQEESSLYPRAEWWTTREKEAKRGLEGRDYFKLRVTGGGQIKRKYQVLVINEGRRMKLDPPFSSLTFFILLQAL